MRRSHLMLGTFLVLLALPASARLPLIASTGVQPFATTGTPTPTPTRTHTRTSTPTITPTPTVCPYVVSQVAGTPVAGSNDIGNNCDDCTTAITLPFSY